MATVPVKIEHDKYSTSYEDHQVESVGLGFLREKCDCERIIQLIHITLQIVKTLMAKTAKNERTLGFEGCIY